jgi:putative acetyltransferase
MNVSIRVEDPAQPDVRPMLDDGEAYSASLYPPQSNHHLSLQELRAANVRFLVARDERGRALATGAVVLNGGWAEIKRMWVAEDARGRGIAKALLARLLEEASLGQADAVRLETGIANREALAFYRSAGFVERGPFADYAPDPLSVFMERPLDAA